MNGSEVTIGLEGQTEEDDDGIKTQLTKTYDLRQKQDFMDFYNKTSLSRTSSIKQRTMALNALWNKMQPKNN